MDSLKRENETKQNYLKQTLLDLKDLIEQKESLQKELVNNNDKLMTEWVDLQK